MKVYNKDLLNLSKCLRKNMTDEEKRLWYDYLRKLPYRFCRQKIVDKYIVDFYCYSLKLIIEIDGCQHYEESALAYDEKRTAFLNEKGFRVIRIDNKDINTNFDAVCEYLDFEIQGIPHPLNR